MLARSTATPVEAVEIRSAQGSFLGVQYHPEISLSEIGQALRAQAGALVERNLAASDAAVESYADALDALDADPDRGDLAWQLGLDAEVIDASHCRREIANLLDWLRRR